MGLIKAALGSAGGVLADQWKEYFYCESMPADVLVTKAHKKVSGRSSNRHGSENIISNGSVIAVSDGQCMLIVEQGKVVDVCAEPGEYTYDTSSEPSIFCGGLGKGVKEAFQQIGKRFTFGGEPPKDQRVYFVNTKELVGNKYGTPNPVPFRVVDMNIGLDMDITIKCFGEYSYQIANPVLFYTNVCGNVEQDYTRDEIDGQLKSELMTALQPAFARISEMGIRYSALPGHTQELSDALNKVLSDKWDNLRGIRCIQCKGLRGRRSHDQGTAEECCFPQSYDGGSPDGGCTGECDAVSSFQSEDGTCDGICGNEHGGKCRWSECTEFICDGTAAGDTADAATVPAAFPDSTKDRMDLCLRCSKYR